MSYPWWEYEVSFVDGIRVLVSATGLDPIDALSDLARTLRSPELLDRGDVAPVVNVRYVRCLTTGIDDDGDIFGGAPHVELDPPSGPTPRGLRAHTPQPPRPSVSRRSSAPSAPDAPKRRGPYRKA